MIKKLLGNSLIYGLAPHLPKVLSLVTLPIITPYLTAHDYGIIGILAAIVGAVSVFSKLGLEVAMKNAIIKSPNHYKIIWRQIYGFLNLWSFVYSLLVGIVIYLFIPIEAKNNALLIILLNTTPIFLFGPSYELAINFFRFKNKPFEVAWRVVLFGSLLIILNVLFIKYFNMGYLGWMLSSAITEVLKQASVYYFLNFKLKIKPIYNFKKSTILSQLRYSIPAISSYYSSYFITISDRLIMKFLKISTSDIGRYNVAHIPSGIIGTVGWALNISLEPMLMKVYKSNDIKVEKRLITMSMLVVLFITFSFSLFSKEILSFLFRNDDFKDVYYLVIVICMGYTYRPMYTAVNTKLNYHEKSKVLLKITGLVGTISVFLNIFLINYFGYKAVVIVVFICFMILGFSGFFLKEFKKINTTNFNEIRWLLLIILTTVVVYNIVDFNIGIKMLIELVVSGVLGIYLFLNKQIWK